MNPKALLLPVTVVTRTELENKFVAKFQRRITTSYINECIQEAKKKHRSSFTLKFDLERRTLRERIHDKTIRMEVWRNPRKMFKQRCLKQLQQLLPPESKIILWPFQDEVTLEYVSLHVIVYFKGWITKL